MSDSGKAIFPDFGKLVPGFDFLQNLAKQASGAASNGMPKMPNLGSWVAPTVNVEELDRRIQELKTVQFWLDQNATALKATIQALEVQKMTLAALQGMNVNMADMAKAFQMPDASGKGGTSGAGAMGGMSSGMAAATDLANTMASNMASTMASMSGMAGMGGKAADAGSGGAPSASPAAGAGSSFIPDKPHHHFAGLEVPETGFMRREQAREQARSEGGAHASSQGAHQVRGNGAAHDTSTSASQDAQNTQESRDPAAEAAKVGAGMAAVIDPMQWWGALTQQFQTIANSAMQDVSQRKPFEASQSLAQDALRTASKTASDFAESASKTLAQGASSARDLLTGAMNVGEAWPMPAASRGASSGTSKGSSSRSASSSRKSAPARAGAMASDDKASSGRGKAGAKTAKPAGAKGSAGRASKAEGKAEGKGSRSTASSRTSRTSKSTATTGGRGAPQARGNTAGSGSSRGGKARSTPAARKASPRAR